jgi:hypothetical protein
MPGVSYQEQFQDWNAVVQYLNAGRCLCESPFKTLLISYLDEGTLGGLKTTAPEVKCLQIGVVAYDQAVTFTQSFVSLASGTPFS